MILFRNDKNVFGVKYWLQIYTFFWLYDVLCIDLHCKILYTQNMNFTIRSAGEADFPAILSIIKALALFERAPEKVTNTVEQMKAEKDYFNCLVAVNEDDEVIAICLYFFAYYTWVGKSLYLDDLYVLEQYRRHGIAAALLNELFEIARREQCNRVRWQVLDWNETAINFYQKINATLDYEWVNCDFDKKGIMEFKI